MGAYVSVHLGTKNKEREENVLVDCFEKGGITSLSKIHVALCEKKSDKVTNVGSRARTLVKDFISYGVIVPKLSPEGLHAKGPIEPNTSDGGELYQLTDTGRRLIKEIIRERRFEKEFDEERYSELFDTDVEEEQAKDHKE